VVGLYLFIVEFRDLPRDFFVQWGILQQVAYSAAVAHWLVSLIEDNLAGDEIISQVKAWPAKSVASSAQTQVYCFDQSRVNASTFEELSSREGVAGMASQHYTASMERERQGLFAFLYCGLMSHHFCALFPFCWTLVTHELAGICLLGLLFELPVLLLNLRDILVSFDGELIDPVPWKKVYVVKFWVLFQALWQATRTASCVLYFVSLGVWRHQVHDLLSPESRVVYHTLGCLFSWVNFILLCTVLPMYLFVDLKRCSGDSVDGTTATAADVTTMTNKLKEDAEL